MLKRIALAAALALGPFLFTGAGLAKADTGAPKTYGDAMRWYKQAARAGNPRAQYYLGLMYERGINVKEDAATAASWFAKAAAQGHAEAQFKLALIHEKGAGVPM
ncbi:MAG: sel1 repeat family protein, partial [Proteobacteria bacterium]|nr:sel1 repeat family protein [Pseudomonadota bacterium]